MEPAMDTVNLTHHFLIAMPTMQDPNFSGTLTYIADHGEQGALGVVVNRPTDLPLEQLFEQIGLTPPPGEAGQQPIYYGGPVQGQMGFVLHVPPQVYGSTLIVCDTLGLTTSRDVLEALSAGTGPGKFLISLGYAGWSPGQLEEELGQNAWLSVAADPEVIFDLPAEQRLPAAMKLLGVNPAQLAATAGHA
jgi:putative transcriptional regulator